MPHPLVVKRAQVYNICCRLDKGADVEHSHHPLVGPWRIGLKLPSLPSFAAADTPKLYTIIVERSYAILGIPQDIRLTLVTVVNL